ncbi:tRNA (N(6)-L-threonylcarbamoyladenosine(37)-C(2))-methylthiotransferase MtaB [Ruminococcaceae bacterium OttesenSCG-928-I18]|nr:tRNA (N(6)-L-threonylcarbamoyladenosine(37)-C(2))-methylthiotransferase MtaB [Ruminococcaceae bacterium OttesenSCG-928-I18]
MPELHGRPARYRRRACQNLMQSDQGIANGPLKVALYTLGCKVNQTESAALAEMLRRQGYEIVAPGEKADVYIVNSCTVTAEGSAKSRRWLRRAKRDNPGAVTVMTGCFPQAFPQEALASGADILTGASHRRRLPGHIAGFLETGRKIIDIAPQDAAFEELPAAKPAGHTRAFLKVQDGCNRRCAYCVIPVARGPSRSRAEGEILRDAALYAREGTKEIVLTGINLPSYGLDTGKSLAGLVERLAEIEGLYRIRLSSLDPDLVRREDIERFAAVPKLCPQFHLSLQSGSGKTLKRMRRPYTPEEYMAAADALRSALPGAMLTTDLIVGFPGESEADFEESVQFMKSLRFLKVHVFPFSSRKGTPAAEMQGQIPRAEKERRAGRMQRQADVIRAEILGAQQGKIEEVLLETPQDDGRFTGYTRQYLPVCCLAPRHRQGEIITVRLGKAVGERIDAEVL